MRRPSPHQPSRTELAVKRKDRMMPRVVAIVPMRHSSERVKGKNYRVLGDAPLFHHVVRTLLATLSIDEVVIDTDSPTVREDAAVAFPTVRVVERPEHLRDGAIAMNDVLLNTIEQVNADVVLQTHSTNPFLSSDTVQHALDVFLSDENDYDSVFGVTRIQARLWDKNTQAVNHDPAVLLRTQDLDPIYLENSCFYIFTPDILKERGNRIGAKPAMIEVPAGEAIDIDEESDWDLAVAVWNMKQAQK
jgi:CMP-N-acetylneuraminic acid synthetase